MNEGFYYQIYKFVIKTNNMASDHHRCHIRSYTLIILLFLCIYCPTNITANPVPSENSQNWLNHGGDLKNRRYADKETKINAITASKLKLKWEFYAGKDITATPAIFNGTLYFPSWNGDIYAVKASDGSLVWKKSVSEVTGIDAPGFIRAVNSTVSRSTPTIAEDLVIVGLYAPCVVIALEILTGNLVWMTQLDKHPSGVVTMSGTYYNGGFYVGTSSLEEGATIEQCCTFIGSLAKLDVRTGQIIWKANMLPSNQGQRGGYAGAAIWGSSPSIDINRNLVYIATGNLYSAPENVTECQERQNNQTSPTQPDECIEPDNHSNSILALELETGKIRWYRQLGGYDVWFVACNNLSTPNCPPGPNPDADFGEAPMMLSVFVNGRMKDIVVAVQKSGFAWALDRDNGSLIWSTEVGPGGLVGGGTWGAATDEKKVYTNLVNSNRNNFTLKPSNRITNGGGWVAIDARSGRILWSTADPNNAGTSGPVSVANGVVFGGSTFRDGSVYAMNAITGKIVGSYKTGATVYGGISVSDGCAYVGNGYNVSLGFLNPSYTSGTSLYAFCIY